jgi:hypothetical protein
VVCFPGVAQRRHHYEQAFEHYLRQCRIPYVAVDEARKALLPESALPAVGPTAGQAAGPSLKSFDFVIYGPLAAGHDAQGVNLLVEVKGRRLAKRPVRRRTPGDPLLWRHTAGPRLDAWVTTEDIRSLRAWEALFGPEFMAVFVFVFWCEDQPPDALFTEIFESRGRWYALRAVSLAAYARSMRTRSPKWGTVHVPPRVFEQISQPLTLGSGLHRAVVPGFDVGPAVPAVERG